MPSREKYAAFEVSPNRFSTCASSSFKAMIHQIVRPRFRCSEFALEVRRCGTETAGRIELPLGRGSLSFGSDAEPLQWPGRPTPLRLTRCPARWSCARVDKHILVDGVPIRVVFGHGEAPSTRHARPVSTPRTISSVSAIAGSARQVTHHPWA